MPDPDDHIRIKSLQKDVDDLNERIKKLEEQLATSNKKIKHLYNWRAIYTKNSWDWFNKLEGVLRQHLEAIITYRNAEPYKTIIKNLLSDLDKPRQGNSNPCIECLHEDESCTVDWKCFFEAKSGKRDGARPNCDNCEYLKIKNPHCMECHDFSHWKQQKKPPLLYSYKKYWVRKSKVVAHLNEIINEWMEQQDDDDNVPYLILSDMIEAYINELKEGLEK